jgi:trehalose synthase
MLTTVPVNLKLIDEYREFVGEDEIKEILSLAKQLKGAKVLHINATAYGGGVAELLYTQVPLMRSVGLSVDWKVIQGSSEFFSVTKIMHNILQGMEIPTTAEMKYIYKHYNKLNAQLLTGKYDFVVVHDPQPLAIPYFLDSHRYFGKHWIWRCHLDLTKVSRSLWHYLSQFLSKYDAAIFTMLEYTNNFSEQLPPVYIITPAIDPLSSKNIPLNDHIIEQTLKRYHIDPNRPLVTQVSRFDPWKDPIGVIDAYRLAKKSIPEIQLLLAASMATDDPESWHYYEKAARHAGEDKDIFLLTNMQGVGNTEINAFQRVSRIVLQKSLQEGFGLTVAEAMWKNQPVIGGKVGGITLQIEDGKTGYLVDSVDECAEKIIYLYSHPKQAKEMGTLAKERVVRLFLSTTNLKEYLKLFLSLQK